MTTTELATHADAPAAPAKNGAKAAKKNTLAKLVARSTSDEQGNKPTIRRRRMRFTIDKNLCDPGAFDEDFQIVIESPSTAVELEAIKKYGQDNPGVVPLEMARMCIVSCDGEPVRDSDLSRDALWEALGSKGRGLLVSKWNELSGGGNEAEGAAKKKAEDSTELLV